VENKSISVVVFLFVF